jgi:hypothetical protein
MEVHGARRGCCVLVPGSHCVLDAPLGHSGPAPGWRSPRRAAKGPVFGHSAVGGFMTSESNPAAESGDASVVIAGFDSYRHAEHMLASLGRGFRTQARKGGTTAAEVRGNTDGSLRVTESRVLSAGDVMSTLIRLSLAWTIGFTGLFPTDR